MFQPFDDGPFDKRFTDVLEPDISEAKLEPYRVDRDPSASVPIDKLHEEIESAAACVADISEDNPNVWYELGYAFAKNKPVVMICASRRQGRFPFDIQHRSIVQYELDSPSDFQRLKKEITRRLLAELKKDKEVRQIASNPVKATEGLRAHEISALAFVMANIDVQAGTVSAYAIKRDMEQAGYTELATNLALTALVRKGFVATTLGEDYQGNQYPAYKLTQKGEDWLLENQERLELFQNKGNSEDDIPF